MRVRKALGIQTDVWTVRQKEKNDRWKICDSVQMMILVFHNTVPYCTAMLLTISKSKLRCYPGVAAIVAVPLGSRAAISA